MGHMTPSPDRTAYSFYLERREPRTDKVSEERAKLIGWFEEKPHTFKELQRFVHEPDPFKAASKLLTLNATLGYGVRTDHTGRIVLDPPLRRRRTPRRQAPKKA